MSGEVVRVNNDFHPITGDDSTPLIGMIPEDPPSHWGKLTSKARTASEAYLKFLNKGKEAKKDG